MIVRLKLNGPKSAIAKIVGILEKELSLLQESSFVPNDDGSGVHIFYIVEVKEE